MSTWMNEAAAVNLNGSGFPNLIDPSHQAGAMMDSSTFMVASPATAGFNPAGPQQVFASPQQQSIMVMENGARNPSPSFSTQQNPMYQTSSVIPSKRPRPPEDSIVSSPRQNTNMLPTSRAETPQTAGFSQGFQQAQQPQQSQQPQQQNPAGQQYPHLQPNGSSNATPSPIMANQLRPGSVPQRVSTASPHPFSPASQSFPQASPGPSEHGGTPQPNPYMQNNSFSQGYTGAPSPARPSPSPNSMTSQMIPQQTGQVSGQMPVQMGQMSMSGNVPVQVPSSMLAQMQMQHMQQLRQMQHMQHMQLQTMQQQGARPAQVQQQKMIYENALQQQLQQGKMHMAQMQGQIVAQNLAMVPGGKQPGQMPNGQQLPAHMRPQHPNRGNNSEAFMKSLTAFMIARGKQLNPSPVVDNRPVSLLQLFQASMSRGGYKAISQNNQWSSIAQILGFPPAQHPAAGHQLKAHFEANLLEFEAYAAQQYGKKTMPPQPGGGQGVPPPAQTPGKQVLSGQMSPTASQAPAVMQPQNQTSSKPMPPGGRHASVNGFPTPQLSHTQVPGTPGHSRNSMSRSAEMTSHAEFQSSGHVPVAKGSPSLPPKSPHAVVTTASATTARLPASFRKDRDVYLPCSRELYTYGGFDLMPLARLGEDLELYVPDTPRYNELGNIDIAALTRSLQCGIHAEVRLALDTLATITGRSPIPLQLTLCEDLLEAIVECAEEQLDMLVDNTVEVSDEILIASYEDVVRAHRTDALSIHDVHAFSTDDYDLDRAVDRLLCLTTVLRNLSFIPENMELLAEDFVIKFLSVAIRYLGTRNMFLRTNANTLDLMKDVVVLLSNIAQEVELPGKEQALSLLQFLLAFAPGPVPSTSKDQLFFSPYNPALQPYLPLAVDSLAKLLARDEPNRQHYKTLLSADGSGSISFDLLTRTFALAISPIPDQTKDPPRPTSPRLFTAGRETCLMQGLLAADIIASLAPGHESGLTRTWLSSGTGFAQNLFRLIRVLSSQFEGSQSVARPRRNHQSRDDGPVYMVRLGMSMLRKLSQKARDPKDPVHSIPPNVVPSRDTVFGALQMRSAEWHTQGILGEIITYASLEE